MIDQKLATLHHLRQIETIVWQENLSDEIDIIFNTAAENLARAAAVGQSSERTARLIFQGAFRKVQRLILSSFTELIDKIFQDMVSDYAKTIPRKWFKTISARLAVAGIEDERRDDELPSKLISFGDLIADLFTEPIANQEDEIDDEQWLKIIKELIFQPPTQTKILEILTSPDETGLDWQDRLLKLSNRITDINRLANELAYAYSQGENLQEMRKRIDPMVGGLRSSARRIVRTEGLRIAETVNRDSWDDLGDMMTGVQILAVLDERTRPEHALRNGRIYAKQPKEGQFPIEQLPILPDEPNCRCWSTPILRPPSDFESDPILAAEFENASGAGIPDPTTYDQWFDRVDDGRKKLAVGVRRFQAVEKMLNGRRRPEWTDFIDEEGRLLPIRVLRLETDGERQERKEAVSEMLERRRQRIRQISAVGF